MRSHWGEGLAKLEGTLDRAAGTCTLRFRTRLLVPVNFLWYVGPWQLNEQSQEGIVRAPIHSGNPMVVHGEKDMVEIRCKVGGPLLRFTSFDQYLT